MSLDQPAKDKMVHAAPAAKAVEVRTGLFHFPGGELYHNCAVEAATIEEATAKWEKERKLINPTT